MDEQCERKVKEYLSSIKKSKGSESFISLINCFNEDVDLIKNLLTCIQENHCSLLADSVCESLFITFSTSTPTGVIFCMQFVPALIWAYYNLLSKRVKWYSSSIEVILLAIYNKMFETPWLLFSLFPVSQSSFNDISKKVVEANNGEPCSNVFRLPTLTKSSVYHEPYSTLGSTYTLSEIGHPDRPDFPIKMQGPMKHLDRIPAGFRSTVVKTVLHQYNKYISFYSQSSLLAMCSCVMRLSLCGYQTITVDDYPHVSKDDLKMLTEYPKVNLSGQVIAEMVASLRFILYDGLYEDVLPVLRVLHAKARYTLSAVGLLNVRALVNLIELATQKNKDEFEIFPPIDPAATRIRERTNISTYRSKSSFSSFNNSLKLKPISSSSSSSLVLLSPTNTSLPSSSGDRIALRFESEQVEKNEMFSDKDALDSGRQNVSDINEGYSENVDIEFDYPDSLKKRNSTKGIVNKGDSNNLGHIENELLEYAINNDKTPLINTTNNESRNTTSPTTTPKITISLGSDTSSSLKILASNTMEERVGLNKTNERNEETAM